MLELKKACEKDALEVADSMRTEDRREAAKLGMSAREAAEGSLKAGGEAWTAFYKGKAVCIFGVVPDSLLGPRANLWLLGSERLEKCKVSYFKTCKAAVRALLEKYPVLWNAVDPEYERAHKWLSRLGARWSGRKEMSPGVWFDYFELRRE